MTDADNPKLTESITFKCTDTLKEQLERLAKMDRRKLADYIRLFCEDHAAHQSKKKP